MRIDKLCEILKTKADNKMLDRSPRRSVSNFRDRIGGGSVNIVVVRCGPLFDMLFVGDKRIVELLALYERFNRTWKRRSCDSN